MLSIFPELYTYSLISPLILRVVIGFIFFDLGLLKLRAEKDRWLIFFEIAKLRPASLWLKAIATIEIIGGSLLIIGLHTQVVAIVFALFSFIELYSEIKEPAILKRNIVFYTLIFAISISLIFSGPGFLAMGYAL